MHTKGKRTLLGGKTLGTYLHLDFKKGGQMSPPPPPPTERNQVIPTPPTCLIMHTEMGHGKIMLEVVSFETW